MNLKSLCKRFTLVFRPPKLTLAQKVDLANLQLDAEFNNFFIRTREEYIGDTPGPQVTHNLTGHELSLDTVKTHGTEKSGIKTVHALVELQGPTRAICVLRIITRYEGKLVINGTQEGVLQEHIHKITNSEFRCDERIQRNLEKKQLAAVATPLEIIRSKPPAQPLQRKPSKFLRGNEAVIDATETQKELAGAPEKKRFQLNYMVLGFTSESNKANDHHKTLIKMRSLIEQAVQHAQRQTKNPADTKENKDFFVRDYVKVLPVSATARLASRETQFGSGKGRAT